MQDKTEREMCDPCFGRMDNEGIKEFTCFTLKQTKSWIFVCPPASMLQSFELVTCSDMIMYPLSSHV